MWEPTKLAAYLAVLMIPWTVKPIFGAISDTFPFQKSSKRTYLALVFFISAAGYLLCWLYPPFMTAGLLLSASGLSWGTALLLGLIVEKFPPRLLPYVFSIHFIAYYSASIFSGIAGGKLCQYLQPGQALSTSFAVSFVVCFLAAIATPLWISGGSTQLHSPVQVLRDAGTCLRNKDFWLIAVFIYFWSFAPAFGTPLYFHYTKVLRISQELIGQAGAFYSFGMLSGALLYPLLWKYLSRFQMQVAIGLSVISTLAFLGLNPSNFGLLEFMRGVSGMFGILCINWLAARVAPKGLETFATAFLIGIFNVGTQTSGIVGAHMYSRLFGSSLNPILVVSAIVTSCGLLIYFAIDKEVRSTQ